MVNRAIAILLMGCAACAAPANPSSYKIGPIKTIEWADPPYGSSPLEDKRQFNCDEFKLSDSDIRFALQHAKPVSEKHFEEELVSVGCHADIYVTFKNNDRVFFAIEPTGRIFAYKEQKPGVISRFYYACTPCEDKPFPWASTQSQGNSSER